jgi:leucyl aminopeptidase
MTDWKIAPDPEKVATARPVTPVAKTGLEAALAALSPAHAAFAKASGFEARPGQIALLPGTDGAPVGALFGIGDGEDRLLAAALRGLPAGTWALDHLPEGWSPGLTLLGWALGAYRFDRYTARDEAEDPTDDGPTLVPPEGADVDAAIREAEAVALVRDLVNTPANDMGPAELAGAARTLAEKHGAHIDIVEGDALREDYPMIHAVGRASTRPPRLIDITWGDADAPKVTLVGKGVCFDSGGLNIKTGNYMRKMKKDMGGAANVLGLADLIMGSKLALRLRVLVPAVENAVGGDAYRPGDVLPSRKGISVEIGNTDAEGRLVLGDALSLADDEVPDLLIDCATLTGAARVALGPELPPFYTDDDLLAADLVRAAAHEADPVWRMPLWKGYQSKLDSKIADVSHISSMPMAGSITAALFLGRFVDQAVRWIHFDMYAWIDDAKPGRPAGGEAQAIRAMHAVLRERYPQH